MQHKTIVPALALTCALIGVGKVHAQGCLFTNRANLMEKLRFWSFGVSVILGCQLAAGLVLTADIARASWDGWAWDKTSAGHAFAAALPPVGLAVYIAKRRNNSDIYFSSKFQIWSVPQCLLCWLFASLVWCLAVGFSWTDWVFALKLQRYDGWMLEEDDVKANTLWIGYVVACLLPFFSY